MVPQSACWRTCLDVMVGGPPATRVGRDGTSCYVRIGDRRGPSATLARSAVKVARDAGEPLVAAGCTTIAHGGGDKLRRTSLPSLLARGDLASLKGHALRATR